MPQLLYVEFNTAVLGCQDWDCATYSVSTKTAVLLVSGSWLQLSCMWCQNQDCSCHAHDASIKTAAAVPVVSGSRLQLSFKWCQDQDCSCHAQDARIKTAATVHLVPGLRLQLPCIGCQDQDSSHQTLDVRSRLQLLCMWCQDQACSCSACGTRIKTAAVIHVLPGSRLQLSCTWCHDQDCSCSSRGSRIKTAAVIHVLPGSRLQLLCMWCQYQDCSCSAYGFRIKTSAAVHMVPFSRLQLQCTSCRKTAVAVYMVSGSSLQHCFPWSIGIKTGTFDVMIKTATKWRPMSGSRLHCSIYVMSGSFKTATLKYFLCQNQDCSECVLVTHNLPLKSFLWTACVDTHQCMDVNNAFEVTDTAVMICILSWHSIGVFKKSFSFFFFLFALSTVKISLLSFLHYWPWSFNSFIFCLCFWFFAVHGSLYDQTWCV